MAMNKTLKYSLVWAFLFVLVGFYSANAVVENTSILALYKFNGDYNDNLNGLHNLTNTATTFTNYGKLLQAVNNTISTNYLSFGLNHFTNSNLNNNFTINFWVYTNSSTGTQKRFIDLEGRLTLGTDTNMKISASVSNTSTTTSVSSAVAMPLDQWVLVTLVRNDSELAVYFNGIKNISTSNPAKLTTLDSASRDQRVLNDYSGTTAPALGRLDELSLWNRALNSTEILEMYNNGNGLTYCNGQFRDQTTFTLNEKIECGLLNFTNTEFYNGAVTATKTIQINSTHIAVGYVVSPDSFYMKTCLLNGTSCSSATAWGTGTNFDMFLNNVTNKIVVTRASTGEGRNLYLNLDLTQNLTSNVFNTGSTNYVSAVQINSTNFVIAYQDGGDANKGKLIFCTLNGSSCGSEQQAGGGAGSTMTYNKIIKTSNNTLELARYDGTNGFITNMSLNGSNPYNSLFNTGATSHIDMIEGSDNKLKIVFRDDGDSNKGKFISCNLDGTSCTSEIQFSDGTDNTISINILERTNKLFFIYRDATTTDDGFVKSSNLTGGNLTLRSAFTTTDNPSYMSSIFTTLNRLLISYGAGATSKGMFALSEAFSTSSTVTINSPTATYYNSTSITLNVTTSLNTNLTYSLNGASNVSLGTNINNITTTITGIEGLNNLTVYSNYSGELSSSTVSFTIDTTLPVINNNILSEYNYYNITGFNSSCSDTNLVYCNISINSQNVLLNTTSFNFTTNGNQTYNITAVDLSGNSVTTSGVTLVNPYQYFRAYDSARVIYVSNPYTFGTYSSDINGYITIPLYDLGIGTHTQQFDKSGYLSSNHSFTFNTTSALNTSFNVTPVTITIKVYDEDAPTTQLYFNLTYISNGNSTIYLNQYNFSKYYNDTFNGNLTLIFDSYNYSTRKLYTTLTDNSATSHTVYLKRSTLSTSVIFQTLDLSASAPIEDVEFIFEKYINGTLTPLAEARTDSSGYTYFNMGIYEDYKIYITKSGYVTQTINSIPGKTSYTILMEPENIQQGFAFQGFSYKFIPVTKQQYSLPFTAGVNVVDSDNLLSSWTITVTGDNTSFTQTSINSAGGLVEFNITNASIKYKLNLSGMRDGNYFEFIDYVSFKNQSTKVTTLITEAQNMDNDPEATYDKVMLILFIYVIFVVLGTVVAFGNSTFGAMMGLIPITFFVYLGWLPLGFAILFGTFTILGVLYFQK